MFSRLWGGENEGKVIEQTKKKREAVIANIMKD
jgi:hypothetical protein